MGRPTRPPDSIDSDGDPTPIRSPFKKADKPLPLYVYNSLFYLKQIWDKYPDMDEVKRLELSAGVGDAEKVWATRSDLAIKDYLERVEQAFRDCRAGDYADIHFKANNWAGDALGRQPILAHTQTRLGNEFGPTTIDIAKQFAFTALSAGMTYVIEKAEQMVWFPGNRDDAKAHIEALIRSKKEEMAKTTVPSWTKDHDEKLAKLATEFNVVQSQIATMASDILHMSIRDANKTLHPDRIMAQIRAGLPGWTKQWISPAPTQTVLPLGGTVEVEEKLDEEDDDELTKALADNLQRLASKGAAPAEEDHTPSPDEPTAPVVENKPAPAPAVPPTTVVDGTKTKIELDGEEDLDGRPYTYTAAWTADGKWRVSLKTRASFTDEDKAAAEKIVGDFLHLTETGDLITDWSKDTVPAALVKECREKIDRLIKDAWTEWGDDSDASVNSRVRKLQDILNVQTTAESLQLRGFDKTVKLVFDAVSAEQQVRNKALVVKQETDRQRFEEQQSRALTVAENKALVPAEPRHRFLIVPDQDEQALMSQCASYAVTCKIYPNVAAAWLAIYRGVLMGFQIPTAITWINAFEDSYGRIRIYETAKAYQAVCLREKTICLRFSVYNDTDESATAIVRRVGEPEQVFRYTREDATKAGLWNNDKKRASWGSNPKAMMCHRVARQAAMAVFPDICASVGINDGQDDLEDMDGELPKAASF